MGRRSESPLRVSVGLDLDQRYPEAVEGRRLQGGHPVLLGGLGEFAGDQGRKVRWRRSVGQLLLAIASSERGLGSRARKRRTGRELAIWSKDARARDESCPSPLPW
jgi:hypothetical protein